MSALSTASTRAHAADNARFFTEPLPGRDEPLESPGGAAGLGRLGVDTKLVSSYPPPGGEQN